MQVVESTKTNYGQKNEFIKTRSADVLLNFYKGCNFTNARKKLIERKLNKLIAANEKITLWKIYLYEYMDESNKKVSLFVSTKIDPDVQKELNATQLSGYFDQLNKLFLIHRCECPAMKLTKCPLCGEQASVINNGNFTITNY